MKTTECLERKTRDRWRTSPRASTWPKTAPALTLAATLAAILLARSAFALQPFPYDPPPQVLPFYQEQPPVLSISVYFYDEAGSAGLVQANPPGSKTEVFFDHSTTPWDSVDYPGYYKEFPRDQYPGWLGKPCTFRVTIPTLGVFEGTSFVGAAYLSPDSGTYPWPTYPVFIIPTTEAELGTELQLRNGPLDPPPSPDSRYFGVSVYNPYGSGSKSALSLGAEAHSLWPSTTTGTLTVEYEGSDRQRFGDRASAEVPLFDNYGVFSPLVFWSNFVDSTGDGRVKMGNQIPLNDVRISFHVDGYTTDTVSVHPEAEGSKFWNALLVPIPGPRAGDYPEGLEWQQVATPTPSPTPSPSPTPTPLPPQARVMDALLGIPTADPPPDPNADGLVDIADLISILMQAE